MSVATLSVRRRPAANAKPGLCHSARTSKHPPRSLQNGVSTGSPGKLSDATIEKIMGIIDPYAFRRAMKEDLSLLRAWRARPHVAQWLGEPTIEPEELEDPNIRMWIVECGAAPFAFVQDYDPHAWADHPFAYMPPDARGIDQCISEVERIGLGHGSAIVSQHLQNLIESGVPMIGTDPHPDNLRALGCYRKVGFVRKGDPVETPWGTAMPMEYTPP